MNFKNNHGDEISMEEFERWEEEIADEDFGGWEPVGEVRYGSALRGSAEKTTMSFVLPVAMKARIASEAKRCNCSSSDLIRSYISDGLLKAAT